MEQPATIKKQMKGTRIMSIVGVIILVTGWSCMYPYKSRTKFLEKIAKLEKRDDIIFIESIWNLKSDTLKIKSDSFVKNEIPIIVLGANTFNFLDLYDISAGKKIGLDSTSCSLGEFMTVKIKRMDNSKYMLHSWGCHYGRRIYLEVQ